jgi:hypothetical protein
LSLIFVSVTMFAPVIFMMMRLFVLAPMVFVLGLVMMMMRFVFLVLFVLAPVIVVMSFGPVIGVMMRAVRAGHYVSVLLVRVRSVVDGIGSVGISGARLVRLDHRSITVLVRHIMHDSHASIFVVQSVRAFLVAPAVTALLPEIGGSFKRKSSDKQSNVKR